MGMAKHVVLIRLRLVIRKVGQNAEVMLRPLSRYIAICSLAVRTVFSFFVFLKKYRLRFAQIISVLCTGWRLACVCVSKSC